MRDQNPIDLINKSNKKPNDLTNKSKNQQIYSIFVAPFNFKSAVYMCNKT